MKKPVQIFEVGPRDGLQSEEKILNVDEKVELIEKLLQSGLQDIEVGSFVRPDLIPQLADTDKVIAQLSKLKQSYFPKVKFWAFVPNYVGLQKALESKVDGVSFFIATSNSFCLKNVRKSQKDLLKEMTPLLKEAKKNKLSTRIYISTIIHCPYEGAQPASRTFNLIAKLMDEGALEISLGDTTGYGNPLSIKKILDPVLKKYPSKYFALHLHDTRGAALANVMEGLSHGIQKFDSSIGGLGGCPYAPGASGNLSSEDLATLLAGMQLLDKKIKLDVLMRAGLTAEKIMGHSLPSKALKAYDRKRT